MMKDIVKGSWAEAMCNGDFICLITYSGYRGSYCLDPKGRQIFLTLDVDDEVLGQGMLDVLAGSRFVVPARRTDVWQHPDVEFDLDLYDYKKTADRYSEWVKALMLRFGYKTKRALFKDMKNCFVKNEGELLTVMPRHHEKLEAWGREKDDGIEDVVISADSTPAEIGAALRLAFSRCTG
jgi:hypothetical protein